MELTCSLKLNPFSLRSTLNVKQCLSSKNLFKVESVLKVETSDSERDLLKKLAGGEYTVKDDSVITHFITIRNKEAKYI